MTLSIDGAQGEGGGQILRSSLTLAALTGTALDLFDIRARRSKPGLLRQHLTAVDALTDITGATTSGAKLGSRRLTFRPGRPRGGTYRFSIGSAGSTTLVAQTVLPVLLFADGPSEVTFEGGTHNPSAPPFDFLDAVYFPTLRAMGAQVEARLDRAGFYPAGGGRFVVKVSPIVTLGTFSRLSPPRAPSLRAEALVSRLPRSVAMRELAAIAKAFPRAHTQPRVVDSPGPGNAVSIAVESEGTTYELCTAFGERGRPAERVAEDVVRQVQTYLEAGVPVGEHLADQLVLLMAVAARGSVFDTVPPSLHTRTNVEVVNRFLGDGAVVITETAAGARIERPA